MNDNLDLAPHPPETSHAHRLVHVAEGAIISVASALSMALFRYFKKKRNSCIANLIALASTSKLEVVALCVQEGYGFRLDPTTFFYNESLQIRASMKILPTPPLSNTRYTVFLESACSHCHVEKAKMKKNSVFSPGPFKLTVVSVDPGSILRRGFFSSLLFSRFLPPFPFLSLSHCFFVFVFPFSPLNFFLVSPLYQGGCYEHKG